MRHQTKDLFDDSTMTFGEHLEVLRGHLIKAIIGLVIAVILCLLKGSVIVDFMRRPIDKALEQYSEIEVTDDTAAVTSWEDRLWSDWGLDVMFGDRPKGETEGGEETESATQESVTEAAEVGQIKVKVSVTDLTAALQKAYPERFPTPVDSPLADTSEPPVAAESISLTLQADEFAQFERTVEQSRRAVTLKVEEAFLTYIKVSLIAGLILSSPWIFYQLWMFVAAGLYPHERKYVYVYGLLSLVLFVIGAVFCFYAVFPFVLKFLLSFNVALEIHPQIRISEWISFAVVLPLMFGVSFQLPLVMLFLERINIFDAGAYREKRRMAILVIAVISMLLTPADPMSMLLMMLPLCFLYEFGILLCGYFPNAPSPFAAESS